MARRLIVSVLLVLLGVIPSLGQPTCTYSVINSYPHDPGAFTQGLEFAPGLGYDVLYEGTGGYNQSSLRRVTLATGGVEKQYNLPGGPPNYFGEGITLWNGQIFQLTWQNHVAYLYNETVTGFQQVGSFPYTTEGWGLTHDDTRLIMSDGTATLFFRDPVTFAELGQVPVSDDVGPVRRLNELEYINGLVWANVWLTNYIVKIDPVTGDVVSWIDLTGLLDLSPSPGVLNGIAYDASSDRLFVTGKNWPTLFEILVHTCVQEPIFSDGFETGGTGEWSGFGS